MNRPNLTPNDKPTEPSADQEAEERSGLRLIKGTDDHLPDVQIIREHITRTLREAFELFGFSPCDTPILHYFDILASKYAGGAEILRETYKLTDQGGRELGLRYDLTVPFARLVGMNYQGGIQLPFRRYEIGRVFRDGPVRAGRRREFHQCDVDVVGASAPGPDAELLLLADMVFRRLDLGVRCELNHRQLLSAIIVSSGVDAELTSKAILAIDKVKKIGRDGVLAELRELGIPGEYASNLLDRLSPPEAVASAGNYAVLDHVVAGLGGNATGQAAAAEMRQMLDIVTAGASHLEVRFSPSLARGLEIYTGPVFEFFLQDPPTIDGARLDGAVAAGGRYDKIIRDFLAESAAKSGKTLPADADFPTVGMSFGLEPLTAVMLARQPAEGRRRTVSQVLLVPMDSPVEGQRLALALRERGIRVEVEHRGKRLKKAFQRCDALGIPYAIIQGEDEVKQQKMSLRDLTKGQQAMLSLEEAIEVLQGRRAL